MDYTAAIENFFDKNLQNIIDDISSLVSIRSVRGGGEPGLPFGPEPARALAAALNMCEGMGFSTRNFENYAGTADMNDKEPTLAILAHLDVVDEGDGWTKPPYKAVLENNRLYGRGTSDDKGPAVISMYAMAAAKEIAPSLTKGVRLVLGCAEETGSECMKYYFSKEKLPENVFSPDAVYPVINIEKGRFSPSFEARWPETNALPRVTDFYGGSTANIVPGKASAHIAGIQPEDICEAAARKSKETGVKFTVIQENRLVHVLASGKTAHASLPDEGINAQTALISLLASLPLVDCPSTAALRSLAKLFPHGDNKGAALGIAQSDELSGHLTLAFSVLSFTETGFKAQFDSRVPICGNSENVAAPVAALLEKHGFPISSGGDMTPPHHTPADSPFVKTLLSAYEKYTGLEGKCIAIGGGTYVHGVPGGVAFGCVFSETENNIHGADEFITIDEIIKSGKIFTQVILDLCQ